VASEFAQTAMDRLQPADVCGYRWTITDASLSPDNKFLAYSSLNSAIYLADTTPGRDKTLRLEFAVGNVPHTMRPGTGVCLIPVAHVDTLLTHLIDHVCQILPWWG
jgi:hypothetical protein